MNEAASPALKTALLDRIQSRQSRIGVMGLGYVGLPLAMRLAEAGHSVYGFDVDPSKIEKLNSGQSYLRYLDGSRLQEAARAGRFRATSDFDQLGEVEVIVICVPTPLDAHREPDMKYVVQTAEVVRSRLRRGQLVILESTTYPGTTDDLLRTSLEQSGLRAEEDFFLAYSPEREDPGRLDIPAARVPKVVGGYGPASTELALAVYASVSEKVVEVSSTKVAEATKLTENIFRAVNIALVNELKTVFDRMGIDVWEVLDAAATKPFGFMRFNPGPGWGGHCIPIDPFYLTWKAREYGETTKFIELAGEINVRMPAYVVQKLVVALNDRGKTLKNAKVLLLGLAYKKDIDDTRESPAFEILEHLLEYGALPAYHDPQVAVAPKVRSWPDLPPFRSVPLTRESLKDFDAVITVTDHSDVDYALVAECASLIIDTRGIYRKGGANIVRA